MHMQPIPYVIEATIQRASQASGIDLGFLLHAARRESGYDPDAKARSSSATGLYQFVDQTWLATLKRHGAKYGYARYAALIGQGADGRYYVNGAEARRVVMGLRLDPHAASLMAGELAADHASYLRGRTGRNPTTGELYAAHFLGPQGSARLIEARRATPGADAAAMFPDARRREPGDLLSQRAGRDRGGGLCRPYPHRRPQDRLRPVRLGPPPREAGGTHAVRHRAEGPDRRRPRPTDRPPRPAAVGQRRGACGRRRPAARPDQLESELERRLRCAGRPRPRPPPRARRRRR